MYAITWAITCTIRGFRGHLLSCWLIGGEEINSRIYLFLYLNDVIHEIKTFHYLVEFSFISLALI